MADRWLIDEPADVARVAREIADGAAVATAFDTVHVVVTRADAATVRAVNLGSLDVAAVRQHAARHGFAVTLGGTAQRRLAAREYAAAVAVHS
jgi:hypothetical protein